MTTTTRRRTRFPLAERLLRESLHYLERSHYSDGRSDATCDDCKRATALRRELDALQHLRRTTDD